MIEWLLRNVRVSKGSVIQVLDMMDTDKDGDISLGELVSVLKGLRKR